MSSTIESMILRFKGLTKAEMIAKYNSPNCAPQWDPYDRLLATNAMKLLLEGKVPNEKMVPPTIEEILAPLPESVVEKVAVKTEDMIFNEELMNKDDDLPEGPMIEGEMSDTVAKCDQPIPNPELAIAPKAPNFFSPIKPVVNAVRKGGRPRKVIGGVRA
jgi:hypothetical protein